ncbi:MAG TPA: proton-conducting transporter membrane subunit, partial [Alphaproteobacteria bacterium]|nr:proton-conducting transporter membrane subunit [Alphaproteobacteria bacterium]
FYTAAYAAMNVGAFAVISHFANAGEKYVTLEDYAGLGLRSPVLAATLTFFLMSLIGIPITGGFFAKFYVLSAALQANLVGLTIIGVVNSAVAAYYYLRVIVMMYMREPRGDVPAMPVPVATGVALTTCVLLTLYLGVLPGSVLDYATRSAGQLLSKETTARIVAPVPSSPGQ